MRQRIGLVTLVVSDYDEAIAWFTQKLGFALVQDTPVGAGKRWVVVAPRGGGGTGLLLAKAANECQRQAIGAQAGGRVSLFRYTDDFRRDYAAFQERGVSSWRSRGWSPTAPSPCSPTSTAIAGT